MYIYIFKFYKIQNKYIKYIIMKSVCFCIHAVFVFQPIQNLYFLKFNDLIAKLMKDQEW
jgi:hypothetical protein